MSVLLTEIMLSSTEAASVLQEADICTDSEIQSLTREDLHELFPGLENLKLRKTVFKIIHTQKPIDVLLRELIDFIPHESLRAALTSNGVLVDYLHILKEMKTQMNNVQTFLDAHIGLLEEFTKNQHQEPDKGSLAGTSTSGCNGPMVPYVGQTEGRPLRLPGPHTSHSHGQMMLYTGQTNPQGAQGHSFTGMSPPDWQEDFPSVAKVMYQIVLSGKTFDAHTQLLDKVKAQDPDGVQLIESNQNCQIIIVFCTISTRVGTDVEAAMCEVTGDKPVILVLMHHSHEPKPMCMRTWPDYPNVVLHVDIFFHETTHGLLKCYHNNDAASKIQNKLLEYSIKGRKDTSGNALGVGGDGGVIATATHSCSGGNPRVSDSSSYNDFWRFFHGSK